MTNNQKVLAQMVALDVVQRARRACLPPPQERVMDALKEAIDSKRAEVERMVVSGRFDAEAYREAKAKIARWTGAWNSNR